VPAQREGETPLGVVRRRAPPEDTIAVITVVFAVLADLDEAHTEPLRDQPTQQEPSRRHPNHHGRLLLVKRREGVDDLAQQRRVAPPPTGIGATAVPPQKRSAKPLSQPVGHPRDATHRPLPAPRAITWAGRRSAFRTNLSATFGLPRHLSGGHVRAWEPELADDRTMCGTCYRVPHMKMIQVRNVPDDVHRKLKVRAAREGTTMSDLLLREAERLANRPSLADMVERIGRREPIVSGTAASDLIRRDRDER
jgi:hypothetical protein